MKLIGSLTSPFVRKVRIALAEKRLDYELQVDIPWNEDTQVPLYNPLGKVPALVVDDDFVLYDSRVIVEYLDSLSPVSRLLPDSGRQRIVVKRWEALADGVAEAAITVFLERKRAKAKQDAAWVNRHWKKVERGLAALANDLGDRTWCNGDTYTLADIAVGCTLGYLAFRFPDLEWEQQYPNLSRLNSKLSDREPFTKSVPAG